MPNLIITNACNLSCPFCFASEYLADGDSRPGVRMDVAEFRRQVEFCGHEEVRFCGGEPTTHPDFVEMLALALEKPGRRVFIMTNGVWPARVREFVAALSTPDLVRVKFLVNVLEPALYTDGQWRELLAMLSTVHPLAVTLGITLYKAPMAYDHMLTLAQQFGIERIRFSVASPNTTDPRSWNLDPPRDFPLLAPVVHQLVMDARKAGLRVHSDCGYIPPCFFTPEQIADLRRSDGKNPPATEFRCAGPVDIGPGGEAWRCYGLYEVVRGNTAEFEDGAHMAEEFERRTHELDGKFMFDACATCDFRARGECMGGCFAYRVTRAGLVQLGGDRALMNVVPSVNPQNLRTTRLRGEETRMFLEQGTWTPLNVTALEERVLQRANGTATVESMVMEMTRLGELKNAAPAVTRAVRKLFGLGVLRLERPS